MAKKRANGEGNIRKRADGRWEGRYTAGYSGLSLSIQNSGQASKKRTHFFTHIGITPFLLTPVQIKFW